MKFPANAAPLMLLITEDKESACAVAYACETAHPENRVVLGTLSIFLVHTDPVAFEMWKQMCSELIAHILRKCGVNGPLKHMTYKTHEGN